MLNSHSDMLQVIHDYMSDPETAWSVYGEGAFARRGDASVETQLDYSGGTLITEHCAVRIMINAMTRLGPQRGAGP